MSELGYLSAMLLGIIQGFTEFLPISSSGHLALTQRRLNLDPDGVPMLLFDVLAHLGTLAAVAIVFRRSAKRYTFRLLRESTGTWRGRRHAWRVTLLAILAVLPTAAIGLAFRDRFEAAFDKPLWIGLCLLANGCLLAVLGTLRRGRGGWKDYRCWQAFLIGFAQALAILPGISRSGATICVARYCGWRARWAAEFSFMIAVPAIVGGTILKLRDALELPVEASHAVAWGPMIAGSLLSFFVGMFALTLLLGMVRRAKLHYFAPYCWILGGLVVFDAL